MGLWDKIKGGERPGVAPWDADPRWIEISRTIRIEEAVDGLGVMETHTVGDEHFASCPLPKHPGLDANPSFSYNPEKQVWNCFTCGEGGSIPFLATRILEVDYSAALDWLIQYSEYNSQDDGTFLAQVDGLLAQERDRWRVRNEKALPWYPASKVREWHALAMDEKLGWFTSDRRRIDPEVVEYLQLGYDPEHKKGKNGGYVGPAIIIPVFVGEQCVGWQERWLDDDRPDWVGKYTNTTDFPRDHVLYNQTMLSVSGPIITVESPMTVARLLSAGLPSVATFGAKVTDDQIRLLRSHREHWLSLDNDDAGAKATARLLKAMDQHCVIDIIPPPTHQEKADLGDCDDGQLFAQVAARVPSILHVTGT